MATRRQFLAILGAVGAAGAAGVAGIQLLPGETVPTGDPVIRYGKENCARCRMAISDVRFATRSTPPAPSSLNPAVPSAWDRVVDKALAKRPGDRFSSATELLSVLELPPDQITPSLVPHRDAFEAAPPSIAVLPFVDMSPGRDQCYFCVGLAEEILTDLAQLRGLQVVSRTSPFAFRDRAEDVREIGRLLSVDTVLEGSVRKAGDNLRVSAQLIDTRDGYHLWSDRYERSM